MQYLQDAVPQQSQPALLSTSVTTPIWNYCQTGICIAVSVQRLGSLCYSFLNTHSEVCRSSALYFCYRTTLNHGSLSGTWANISALWYTLPYRSKATQWTQRTSKVEYTLYHLSMGEEFITPVPKALINMLHIVNAHFLFPFGRN